MSKLEGMKQGPKVGISNRFNELDFHDDSFITFKTCPPRSRNASTKIELEFQDDSTGSLKVLSFHGCANLRFIMDFDVLADNWNLGNTKSSCAKTDVGRMRKFVRAQMPHWGTTYMPPMPKDKPVKKKLASIRGYILFRVAFFGGTAEVLAKNYRLTREIKRGTSS